MKLAEFRVYVQVDDPREEAVWRIREFIRVCIENLDDVHAVEVEPVRGILRDPVDDFIDIADSAQ